MTWLPGSLPDVVGVLLDTTCDRNEISVTASDQPPGIVVGASGYPRPITGVPVDRNLSGISFAVANASDFVARLLERDAGVAELLSTIGSSPP